MDTKIHTHVNVQEGYFGDVNEEDEDAEVRKFVFVVFSFVCFVN